MIDVYTRMLYVRTLKSKHGITVCNAIQDIFEKNDFLPIVVLCDKGKEFYNSNVSSYFKKHGIRLYSPSSQIKCGMIERMNRTLKSRLEKYMTHRNTHRYVDVLPDVVNGINNTVNRMIKMRPIDVTGPVLNESLGYSKQCKYAIGDYVRISTARSVFQKGYEKGWSEEIFYVMNAIPGDPPTYELKDLKSDTIDGKFYNEDLTRCSKSDDIYKVEAVLDRKTVRGVKHVFVKWLGFPNSFNSWEPEANIIAI